MKFNNILTPIFELVIVAVFVIVSALCANSAIKSGRKSANDASRCTDAGYSMPYYSEGRVYCLDFGEEPRIMRLSQE